MARLSTSLGSLARGCRSAQLGVACVLGGLLANCATGENIRDSVLVVEAGSERVTSDESLDNASEPAPEVSAPAAEASTNEAQGAELEPVSGEMGEGNPDPEFAGGNQSGDGEPSSSLPADEEPAGDSEVVDGDAEPALDDPEPDTQPNPVPGLPPEDSAGSSGPADPPPASDSGSDPVPGRDPEQILDPAVTLEEHCLADWEGSSCDVCSGQTQSDLLVCRVYIDCYVVNDCDPVSCGSLDEACGVNRLGNGLAPKDIADAVYGCMCAP